MASLSFGVSPAQLGRASFSLERAAAAAWSRRFNDCAALPRSSSSATLKGAISGRRIAVAGISVFWVSVGTGLLVAAAAMSASMAGGKDNGQLASLAVKRGMELFVKGDIVGSLARFDEALELNPPLRPYLWQRGLSLYYLNRFEDAALQFREDVAVNANDTEESIWCFLCEAQLQGPKEARKCFLEVGQDSRPVMRRAYEIFKNGGDPNDLVQEFKHGQPYEVFNAHLYAGLFHESEGDSEGAKLAILAAAGTPYGVRSGDYMASLAKVHCRCRSWDV